MNRAFSTFVVKSIDDEQRVIEGIASTPTVDRQGDIVEPLGAKFTLPLPALLFHDADNPVATVEYAKASKDGISYRMKFPAAGLLETVDRAWTLVKEKLVRGVSIGFRPLKTEPIEGSKTGGLRFLSYEWLELSLVAIPANAEATITTVKQYDHATRAASGHTPSNVVRLFSPPGASGKTSEVPRGNHMKTNLSEQVAAYEATRAANVGRMDELIGKSADAGETFDAAEKEEYATLEGQVKSIDEHLVVLRAAVERNKSTAKPVPTEAGTSQEVATKVRVGEGIIKNNKNLPEGIGIARYAKALAFAKGNNQQAQEYAKQWDDSTPEVALALKSAIAAGTTTDSTWAGPLVYNQNLADAFLDYLRPQTILGKMSGFQRVPFNIRYAIQTAGSTVAWVGEGAGKPVSKLQFSSGTLGFAKAAGIVVITQELARYSSPSAELKVRDDLTKQMSYFLDQQLVDPSVTAVANVSPASILNGASNVRQAAATWTTMANVVTDVKALLLTFTANEIAFDSSMYWIMTPDVALSLSLIPTSGGENLAFKDIGINGGSFLGIPVIVSNSIPHSTSAGSIVALVKASDILLADEGGVAIDASQEASLLMDSAPTTQTSATPTGSSVVSMFQTNSIAIRCERVINWAKSRAYSVGYVDNVHTS